MNVIEIIDFKRCIDSKLRQFGNKPVVNMW